MRAWFLVCAIWVVTACASGKGGLQSDANTSTFEDSGVPEIDAPPKNDFGEPCTSNAQCESGLCILVGTSGQCTKTCGDCPAGYGCLGVTGIQVEGQVTFVCVPTSTQLCTTCTQDSECTLIGMDKCVTYPDGDKACGQDCTTVGCPTGFTCNNVMINGAPYKQCMASSSACDCTAANPGAMQPCNITTPWNVCLGSQTCAGATGWGSCAPPSATDNPDATYTDDNCDGIDGDITKGIFVAGGGANTTTCGLTYTTPCQTISYAIVRAVQASRPNVYVQAGTYNEVVVLLNGINVWGGYDFNWQRGAYSDPAHRVTIVGAQDTGTGGDGQWLTVRAHNLIVSPTVADLIIRGPNALGTGGTSGRDGFSSYALHVVGALVNLERVQIVAGNGANGAAGGPGLDAVIADRQSYMDGGTGGSGDEFSTACNNSSRGSAGPAGTNSCSSSPSSRAMNGGAGGAGGTMDTDCGVFSLNLNARPGLGGSSAGFTSGSFGTAGGGGPTCGNAPSGNPGLAANGGAGSGSSGGYLTTGYWFARAGLTGGTGQNGSGGGGGGGGGGCDDGTDAYGGGGGGGGAGGCAARGGGTGGGGGGGSFGIFAMSASTVTIATCDLTRGNAGNGANGGAGGRGQSGGLNGSPGAHPGSGVPGTGGAGAHGGHGGGGGGGAGGSSIGIVQSTDSTITGTCTQSGGAPGSGGGGGPSAPNAPAAERDGNDGQTGGIGTNTSNRTCASTTSC
jgi:hypothetical protein